MSESVAAIDAEIATVRSMLAEIPPEMWLSRASLLSRLDALFAQRAYEAIR